MKIGRTRKGLSNKNIGKYEEPKILFVIASEGTETEPTYFNAIKDYVKQHKSLNRLVEIEAISRKEKGDTHSDPADIIALLDEVKQLYALKETDELWLLIDRDHRHSDTEKHKMAQIVTRCNQKGYEFCMTTPCFELWLLLHLKTLNDFSESEKQLLIENKKVNASKSSRTYLEKQLLDALGEYSKSNLQMSIFLPLIEDAIKRAYEAKLEENWDYKRFCTRVHVLLTRILQLSNP